MDWLFIILASIVLSVIIYIMKWMIYGNKLFFLQNHSQDKINRKNYANDFMYCSSEIINLENYTCSLPKFTHLEGEVDFTSFKDKLPKLEYL